MTNPDWTFAGVDWSTSPDQTALMFSRAMPGSGQAYRAARDEALADFADELVRAGFIRESFSDGKLVLSMIVTAQASVTRMGGDGEAGSVAKP